MLCLVEYIRESDMSTWRRYVKHAVDYTDAVTRVVDEFFRLNQGDRLKLTNVTEIEMTGDLRHAEEIENALMGAKGEGQ